MIRERSYLYELFLLGGLTQRAPNNSSLLLTYESANGAYISLSKHSYFSLSDHGLILGCVSPNFPALSSSPSHVSRRPLSAY